jgi:Tfp pilus assembly protein FimT
MDIYSNSDGTRATTDLSLIELLIILAIILILAALPISNLVRYEASQNQNSAVANLRTGTTSLVWPLQSARLSLATEYLNTMKAHGYQENEDD